MINKQCFIKRVRSGIVLAIILSISILYKTIFDLWIYTIASIMLYEWYNMTNNTKQHRIYNLMGQISVITSISSILTISYIDTHNWILLTLFICISTVDIMAMCGGKIIGGRKLAPRISPNKTISGLLVGTMSACIVINLLTYIPMYHLPNMLHTSHMSLTLHILLLGISSQAGDLFVSYFKRKCNIKDTGTIIPGHGGVLDRFDSIIFTAPITLIYLYLNNT